MKMLVMNGVCLLFNPEDFIHLRGSFFETASSCTKILKFSGTKNPNSDKKILKSSKQKNSPNQSILLIFVSFSEVFFL